jgi:hypothetical protein
MPGADSAADAVLDELRFDARLDPQRLATTTGLSPERVRTGITVLASQGLVGFDTGRGAWFHRPLPYDATLTEKLHPRLASANGLADEVSQSEDGSYQVGEYRTRIGTALGDTCTCAWWGKYRGERGPCKHVLAVRMHEARR